MEMLALPPATIIGNYKLLKELGQGGFGITYIAWDAQLQRNVVLKECFPRLFANVRKTVLFNL